MSNVGEFVIQSTNSVRVRGGCTFTRFIAKLTWVAVGRKHMRERNKRYSTASIVNAKPSFLVGSGEVPKDEIKSVEDQNRRGVCEEQD